MALLENMNFTPKSGSDQYSFIKTRKKNVISHLFSKTLLLHFVAFFHVASLLSTRVDNEKVGVDNEKALELTNSTVFHRGRQ